MGEGITILLIAAIGIGYFLYQKFQSGNRGRNMTRTDVANVMNRIIARRNRSENRSRPQQVPGYMPPRPANGTPLVPAQRENITETGPMIYFANDRHNSGDREYRFNYKKVGNGWRAYILRMPGLGNRDAGSGTIHRLHDDGGYYICWNSQVNTLKDMQVISRHWADNIQNYIATGRFGQSA